MEVATIGVGEIRKDGDGRVTRITGWVIYGGGCIR